MSGIGAILSGLASVLPQILSAIGGAAQWTVGKRCTSSCCGDAASIEVVAAPPDAVAVPTAGSTDTHLPAAAAAGTGLAPQ